MTNNFSDDDFFFMREALAEAQSALALAEVPAGAVIVDDKKHIVARGHNQVIAQKDPTAHAEIRAIREAAQKLNNYRLTGLTLYSTLEPCPMCLYAAIHSRLKRLVFGAPEPKWGAAGSVLDLNSIPSLNHHLVIEGGLLAKESREIIVRFFQARRQK